MQKQSAKIVGPGVEPIIEDGIDVHNLMIRATTDGDRVDISPHANDATAATTTDDRPGHPLSFIREQEEAHTIFRPTSYSSGEAAKFPDWLVEGTKLMLENAGVVLDVGDGGLMRVKNAGVNVQTPHPFKANESLTFENVPSGELAHAAMLAGLELHHNLSFEQTQPTEGTTGRPIEQRFTPGER